MFSHALSCRIGDTIKKSAFKLNTVSHFLDICLYFLFRWYLCSSQTSHNNTSVQPDDWDLHYLFFAFTSTPGSSFSQCRRCKAVSPLPMLYLHVYCVPLLSPCPGAFFTSLLSERATLSQRQLWQIHLTKKIKKQPAKKQEARLQENT